MMNVVVVDMGCSLEGEGEGEGEGSTILRESSGVLLSPCEARQNPLHGPIAHVADRLAAKLFNASLDVAGESQAKLFITNDGFSFLHAG